jgi:hypothetical protein
MRQVSAGAASRRISEVCRGVSVGQRFAVFASHACVRDLGMNDRANRKRLILRRSRMHRPSVWIATLLLTRFVGHFFVHGMPDVGRVISLRAAFGTDRRRA